jgi:hypothetical protein
MIKLQTRIPENIRNMQITEILDLLLLERPITQKEVEAIEDFLPILLDPIQNTILCISALLQIKRQKHIKPWFME